MHAAIITANLRNVFRSKESEIVKWEDFMVSRREEQSQSALGVAVNQLIALATPVKASKAEKRRKKRDRSRKARRKA